MIEQQPIAEYGSMRNPNNGRTLTDIEVDGYNRYTIELNRTSYLQEREFLMDQRHRYFLLCGD